MGNTVNQMINGSSHYRLVNRVIETVFRNSADLKVSYYEQLKEKDADFYSDVEIEARRKQQQINMDKEFEGLKNSLYLNNDDQDKGIKSNIEVMQEVCFTAENSLLYLVSKIFNAMLFKEHQEMEIENLIECLLVMQYQQTVFNELIARMKVQLRAVKDQIIAAKKIQAAGEAAIHNKKKEMGSQRAKNYWNTLNPIIDEIYILFKKGDPRTGKGWSSKVECVKFFEYHFLLAGRAPELGKFKFTHKTIVKALGHRENSFY